MFSGVYSAKLILFCTSHSLRRRLNCVPSSKFSCPRVLVRNCEVRLICRFSGNRLVVILVVSVFIGTDGRFSFSIFIVY